MSKVTIKKARTITAGERFSFLVSQRVADLENSIRYYKDRMKEETSLRAKDLYEFKIETCESMLKYNKYLIGIKD